MIVSSCCRVICLRQKLQGSRWSALPLRQTKHRTATLAMTSLAGSVESALLSRQKLPEQTQSTLRYAWQISCASLLGVAHANSAKVPLSEHYLLPYPGCAVQGIATESRIACARQYTTIEAEQLHAFLNAVRSTIQSHVSYTRRCAEVGVPVSRDGVSFTASI